MCLRVTLLGANNVMYCFVNMNYLLSNLFYIWLNAGKMVYHMWCMHHLVHFYILFSLQYNMTIQFGINNIYNNNYASAIRHSIYVVANGRSINTWRFFSNAIPNY